ncbi:hypothetical protein [Brucella anthropi]|uniref:hypothetical protein n=1 Tax=Brucella anthropi TaxID=529 RepID=UPI0005BE6B65|nr:hypothetical protein [Brucella anthropi]KIU69123.1 hypothetical protein TR92_07555 [Brucella anthropi]
MAKQPKTETNTPKVPEAELVGDRANAANGGKNAGADSGAASVPATATGEVTAPVATSSTDTTASGSGDAAGTVTTGLVKPQEAIQPTTAIPAGADEGTSSPEVEASTSGTSSTDTPPSATAGGAGDLASAAEGGISSAMADAIISKVLGVEQPEEKREFVLMFGPVRHNNVHYKSGAHMILTRTEHEQVCADRLRVVEWDKGQVVD